MAQGPDALLILRKAIAAERLPITTSTPSDDSEPAPVEQDLAKATHLQFHHAGHISLPLTSLTRFELDEKPVDLRSVYFAWLKKDVTTTEYVSAVRTLSEELAKDGSAGGSVQNLVFAQKVDLTTWLEGASEESEFIRPLDAEAAAAQAAVDAAADVASGATGVGKTDAGGTARLGGKTLDPRLREIYNGERRMGDRNSALRGIKPTDFSHVRKHAEAFLGRNRKSQTSSSRPPNGTSAVLQNRSKPATSSVSAAPGRSREPIILLSPSASSLLRMSNIRAFLDSGTYTLPDSATGAPNILHISRLLPSIDSQRPLRFILVDSADQFKPDYWNRVVAVFTTGQLWQFKGYLWQSPPDLFSHALGLYVGWRGEETPQTVKGWGRGVMSTQIDKYNAQQGASARWRDREVVEGIWTAIEESMRRHGWGKEVGR